MLGASENGVKFQHRWYHSSAVRWNPLWQDGILCAYQYVENADEWVAIGWDRITEIVKNVKTEVLWWCHFSAGHHKVNLFLENWLPPAASVPLRLAHESIHENLHFNSYAHPVIVSDGLLVELHGHATGSPLNDENDIHIMLRCWQFENMLITVQHVLPIQPNGPAPLIFGISDMQDLLCGRCDFLPKTLHHVLAQLAFNICGWDDRLFRNTVFCAADEIEIKFINRKNENWNLTGTVLNDEIRSLLVEIIRVKWYLHARDEVVCDLLALLRGDACRILLETIRKSTSVMLEDQEAVRSRLFTLRDVIQSTGRALVQEKSQRVTHNCAVLGGCAVILSIFTGLFGINLDGIPGAHSPYAFTIFTAVLVVLGIIIFGFGVYFFGMEKPVTESAIAIRKKELNALAKYYVDEVKDKTGKGIDVTSWKFECVEDLPEQKNGFDCGVFMIKYADFYSRGLDLCFQQKHMPYFRLRTAKEVLQLRAD